MVVTSIDVAKRAGVSQATVSRALRDRPGTSEATRRRVRDAARELGYIPLQSGRSLSTRRSKRVGIVVGELTNPFYPTLVEPVLHELAACGYLGVLMHDSDLRQLDTAPIFDGSLDGALLTTTSTNSALPREIERRGIPFVMVNREVLSGPEFSASVPDNVRGVTAVADLFLELGHHRIGVVAGPQTTSTGQERLRGFQDALARRGTALHPDLVRTAPFTVEAGFRAAADLLGGAERLTALFCGNDVLALGALEAAMRAGLSVPGDLSVVGFDDIPFASLHAIDLTTVTVDLASLAAQATAHLITRIEEPTTTPLRIVHPVTLKPRGTHSRPSA